MSGSVAAPAGGAEARPVAAAPTRRRWRGWVIAGILALGLSADLARPPAEQWSAAALLGAIHLYQHTLSPAMPWMGVQCRFTPTCSHYAEGAIKRDGALIGSTRASGRVLRCGPWTPQGTVDPP